MPKFGPAPSTAFAPNTVGALPWLRRPTELHPSWRGPDADYQPPKATHERVLCSLGTCAECDAQRHQRWNNDFRRGLGRIASAWRNEQDAKILAKAKLRKRKPHCRLCGELTTLRVGLWPASNTYPETLAMDLVVSGIQCTYCGNRVAKWAIVTSATLLGEYTV